MICLPKIIVTLSYPPVEDKPGYYYFGNKGTIISKEVLKKAIEEYNDKNLYKLLLSDPKLHS